MNKDENVKLGNIEEIKKQNDQKKKDNRKKKKNKRERKSVFERFTTKENIIIFSFLLIFLIIGWNLVKKYDPYRVIDYRNVDVNSFITKANVVNDRETYWMLNGILLNLLYSDGNQSSDKTNGEGSESSLYYKYSTEEYYKALDDDYKIYLKKDHYLELMNQVILNYKENYETLHAVSDEAPIRKIYKLNDIEGDYYLVRLNTSKASYIGIHLFKKDSQFKIFYLF